VGFSPETADGGGAEKMARCGGVLRRWRSSGGRGGGGSMSPVAGGGDRGGEAWSKRVGRRGCDRAHRGGENGVAA
jgi:hypothetical protein